MGSKSVEDLRKKRNKKRREKTGKKIQEYVESNDSIIGALDPDEVKEINQTHSKRIRKLAQIGEHVVNALNIKEEADEIQEDIKSRKNELVEPYVEDTDMEPEEIALNAVNDEDIGALMVHQPGAEEQIQQDEIPEA